MTLCNGHNKEDDAWNLDARKVSSDILESPHAENLYIMGVYDKYDGFKIYVNIKNKFPSMDKFLLMGHQHHYGPFVTDEGVDLADHPHFHQIKYSRRRFTGERSLRKTHEFSPLLFAGMNSEQFLKAFLINYYFDHVGDGEIQKVAGKQIQSELGNFDTQAEGNQ